MPHWECDKCDESFEMDDIPEKCPKCGADDGTFSLIE
jgi:rubrerythrin